jgi:ATP-binding cassette, subfamily B, bacterial MsbA
VIAILLIAHRLGLSLPVMAAFLILMYRMQPHISALSQARLGLAALGGSVSEVEWLLDADNAPAVTGGDIPARGGAIRFDDVSYAYPGRTPASPAVHGLSFVLEPGLSTALIGRSGAGKSTIVNLLCGLIEPTAGQISVDGIGLINFDRATWRRCVALAGQDLDLVDGTIGDNIAYGKPDATAREIEDAARLADAHDFITSLSAGYATRVDLRGLSLSGGQRQRIGLARALIRDPEFLILDEATNAVDGISEQVIMGLLRQTRRNRTTIVISHRRSTLAACQAGIVLDNGTVVESGPLRQLAFYRHMEAAESDNRMTGT